MMKKLFSAFLALTLLLGCFSAVPVTAADPEKDSFIPEEHLIKENNKSYKVVSLDKKVTMNFYLNGDNDLCYSVEKQAADEITVEILKCGDIDFNDIVNVSDVVSIRQMIMSKSFNQKQFIVADMDKNGSLNVSDVVSMRQMIMSRTEPETVEYKTTTPSTEVSEWVQESKLGVMIDGVNYFTRSGISAAEVSEINRTYDHNGNQSTLTDNGVAATFSMVKGRYTYFVDVRVYNDGVTFRYRLPDSANGASRTISDEMTTFVLKPEVDSAWYGVNNRDYEAVIERHNPADSSSDCIVAPITAEIEQGSGGYIAIQEAGVSTSYAGTNFRALGNNTYKIANTWNDADSVSYDVTGDVTTGWRVISLAETLDQLVNNYIVYHVNEAPDAELYADTSWIEPGRSAWSWLTDYGATLATADAMYTYTENCARLGFEYNIIDDGYTAWNNYRDTLGDLGDYGNELNVKQLLWAQISTSNRGMKITNAAEAEEYLDFLKENNLYGGKIDFWWSEADTDRINRNNAALQEEILKMAAERQLIINFHGCNKPAGLDATYPNELTREAVRGLENIGASANTNYTTQSSWLTAQLFTRYLSGHADWTPACDTAMQIASLICIDSPLNVIATNPERILKNEAVEMIKSIPTVWDQTKVLSGSKIGSSAIYAKESKGTWFMGGIMNTSGDISVKLSEFLPGDGDYSMELWYDNDNGGKTRTVTTVNSGDTIDVSGMQAGKGFAARFSKLSLNQYGGEILFGNKLEMTAVSDDSVIKYTTDGSDPATSTSAVIYTEPVQLTSGCDVTAAIVSGDGAGTVMKYRFNIVGEKSIYADLDYKGDSTGVTLKTNFDCDLYYTTDGSQPSAASEKYTGSFDVTSICVLKVVGIPKDGSTASYHDFPVFVAIPEAVAPDIYLGGDYVSASTDWGSVKIDKNLNGDVISLGGTNATNGTKYEHGFGLNANGHLLYNIPEGATQFVGVIGIDDKVYENVSDGVQASSTLTIEFDDTAVLTTPIFRMGEYYNIVVDVPEGASRIKLVIGDGGNGITCDNVSMGNAGWILGNKTKNEITYTVEEKDGLTRVSLSPNFIGTIYYTTDGSEPGTGSDVYSGTLLLTSDCTLKIKGIPDDGDDVVELELEITVKPLENTPDVYLSNDYISATTGWSEDPASVNTNTKGGLISIAGTEYLHGIATNAVGEFVYNIPANALQFVGIVGVDDVVKQNTNDGHKASIICTIYFDGSSTPAYQSGKLTPEMFDTIRIDVPSGATTIRIVFGDADDGITCDNASMGNAGWIISAE